ncbi:MAG: hypothetical protein JEY99_09285 [Spirochaetales bacterium]|nr:hypothetical protein [Spirochaetales bacterium]
MKIYKPLLFIFLIFSPALLSAGELLSSFYQDYFRYLAVQGKTENPALMNHSLSGNDWELDSDHPWQEGYQSPSSLLNVGDWNFYATAPNVMISANTSYARNELSDGSWWQGKGVNTFVTGGFKIKSSWFSLNFQPEFWSSQNLGYDILAAVTDSEYGYFFSANIDYPQRMGDESLYEWGLGQTDIRFNWWNFTLALSNENILWGPSLVNSLMISDNAAGFPHIEFGLKKTETAAGDVELISFRGRVEESDYYDEDPDNNYTFMSGITGGYSPVFLPGFTFGLKWTLMTDWDNFLDSWQLQAFGYDYTNDYFGGDEMDMKGSLTMNWIMPEAGFEWYFEFFREDYSPSLRSILLAPGHSAGYTLGGQKAFPIDDERGWSLTAEWNELIQSRDYEIDLGSGGIYYSHGYVKHGYTNLGQMLGAGIGPGSDSEILRFDYYDTWGKYGIYFQRICWNKMYLYRNPVLLDRETGESGYNQLNTELNLGFDGLWMINKTFHLSGEMILSYNLNRNYIMENDVFNLYTRVGLTYRY